MIIEIILALLLGILAGTFTGLMPGIHINLISAFLVASLSYFSSTPLIALAVFIASMSITHTFLDFIPSIFLGAPNEDTFLSILPGHEMLLQGQGFKAVFLSLIGSLTAIPIILIFTPLFILFLPPLYLSLKFLIPFILIFISIYLILREQDFFLSAAVFILSGFLGLITFNLPIEEPLLPLLTGLFGTSAIILSIKNENKIQKQKVQTIKESLPSKKEYLKASLASLFAPLFSFLPGIGSGHAATLASEIVPQEKSGFLILTGSINTIIMALSFITIYSIGKARSGTAAAVQEILKNITLQDILIILAAIVVSALLAFFLGIKISRLFALYLNKINYKLLNIFVIAILIIINIIFTNYLGLIVLITSTALGIFCITSNARRINLMGALIIPAVVYYLMN